MSSFKNILLFGTGGTTIGHHILQTLLHDATFNITVLARQGSKTVYPSSVSVIKVPDHFPHAHIVQALQDQDVVISTVGFSAVSEQYKLIDAAVEVGVKRFFPSEWGMDNGDVDAMELSPVYKAKGETALYLQSKAEEHPAFSWTAVATGMWLDWALDVRFLDIDPVAHTAKYWREGTHRPAHTTLTYSATAVLQLLKRPDIAINQRIFLAAFEASQREIVASLERLQGVEYTVSDLDANETVQLAKEKWVRDGDVSAAYMTVKAGILLSEFKGGFVSSGKEPMLERLVEMPELTLDGVVTEWVEEP